VSRAVELQQRTDDQLPVGFDGVTTDLENVHRFEAAFTQVRAALCPPVALSTYSPGYRRALETYHRGARCSWLNAAPLSPTPPSTSAGPTRASPPRSARSPSCPPSTTSGPTLPAPP
jgi:hypothetical protein